MPEKKALIDLTDEEILVNIKNELLEQVEELTLENTQLKEKLGKFLDDFGKLDLWWAKRLEILRHKIINTLEGNTVISFLDADIEKKKQQGFPEMAAKWELFEENDFSVFFGVSDFDVDVADSAQESPASEIKELHFGGLMSNLGEEVEEEKAALLREKEDQRDKIEVGLYYKLEDHRESLKNVSEYAHAAVSWVEDYNALKGNLQRFYRKDLQELLTFLDELRESGEVNMHEAPPQLRQHFSLTKKDALEVFQLWCEEKELFPEGRG